ncbi:MAG: cell division protein ZapE, partial [Gammaproteobacteria bacterium]|nr:cell division protein ZapE [Gammaproteobacteria bacterium]
NIAPEDLYKNGLQRDRFLPAIDLIQQFTTIFELENNTDYRMTLLEQEGTYHVCVPHESSAIMEHHLEKMSNTSIGYNTCISINQRDIRCKALSENQIWFDFPEICQTPRSSADYVILAREYQTMLISNMPVMDDGQNDIVQRLIQLIDALYDHKVKLVTTALGKPEELYTGKGLAFPFQRTASRLHEMQSEAYLSQAHIAE